MVVLLQSREQDESNGIYRQRPPSEGVSAFADLSKGQTSAAKIILTPYY